MRQLKYLSFLLLFIAFATGCTKDGPEGPVGAVGPQGVPGTNASAGSKGPTGDIGSQGPPGTNNVIYSSWVASPTNFFVNTGNPNDWFDTTLSTIGLVSRANFLAPSLTQAILDQGVTMVYHTFASPPPPTGGANAQALPYFASAPGLIIEVNYRPVVGRIVVFLKNLSSTSSFGFLGGHYFRYVIIPGGVSGGRMMGGPAAGYTVEQLQTMSYDQVIKKFSIPYNGGNAQ